MTVRDITKGVFALRHETPQEALICNWANELDGMLWEELFCRCADNPYPEWKPVAPEEADTRRLLIPAPYESIYLEWIRAKMDDWNQEVMLYNGSIAVCNAHLEAFKAHWRRLHRPKQPALTF